ncbi:hypothetical protein [Streptomyces lavendulocolor]|uniref:hypothetical protein n=1 Tax=Streptomyces lavendulocolor TaxID=67316 RepID=UPI003C2B5AF8
MPDPHEHEPDTGHGLDHGLGHGLGHGEPRAPARHDTHAYFALAPATRAGGVLTPGTPPTTPGRAC